MNALPSELPGGWKLNWHDEFDGEAGSAPDPEKWTYDIGGDGWGNREWQYYTDRQENVALDGNGHLVITAQAVKNPSVSGLDCWYGPCMFTSARLLTRGKFEFMYGRVEARIQIPYGQGLWPAFWMLGNDIAEVGWPACGEIDIMENIGREPNIVHGTVHGPGFYGAGGLSSSYALSDGAAFADDFHVYAVEWEAEEIRWYVDGRLYGTVRKSQFPETYRWVFDHPFFIILNVAVGGNWPGYPDETTIFPQAMRVDYVRVYQR
ncbi:MAG: glycoside hydrolase family 16 protein [Anaerolineales bacterium]|nr:glycoside hydrolase family 16 protein [Anaerolineales bacterium]MDW8227139.1 glycoside hydrolase family 16 protein [Anaerolineales bacterium]